MDPNTQKILQEFAKKSPIFFLSTCSKDGQPQSSLMYFALAEKATLYFFSKEETRKSKNLAQNPKIALLMEDVAEQKTLQMEGVAQKITDPKEVENTFDFLMQTLSIKIDWPPPAGKIEGGNLAFYKVTLTWARLGHFKDHNKNIFTQLIP